MEYYASIKKNDLMYIQQHGQISKHYDKRSETQEYLHDSIYIKVKI